MPPIARACRGCKGRKLPLVDRIEISIMEEANPRLLAFESRALEYVNLPPELSDHALDASNGSSREYAARGRDARAPHAAALQYAYFNMQDPVVGGYTNDKVALRRALVLGFNTPNSSASSTRARRSRRRNRFRPMCRGTTKRSTLPHRTIPPQRVHCSTSSATSTATATAGAICRMASR